MLVQVLDDSDDLDVQDLINAEVQKWQQRGVRILYRHRLIRTGYKAGNLKSAMSCDYVKDYEFVAIFDADFQPAPDFLKKTVPYFKVNLPMEGSGGSVGLNTFLQTRFWQKMLIITRIHSFLVKNEYTLCYYRNHEPTYDVDNYITML